MSEIALVRKLFADAKVDLRSDDVWEVQKTPVVKHKALERLADALEIRFKAPVVLRHERDEAVILVTAVRDGVEEWSIGEALVVAMVDSGEKNKWGKPIYEAPLGSTGNYQVTPKQGGYPYAMAEKRAKDRVIIKLAKLQGVYSEEEADDFKAREEPQRQEPPAERKPSEPMASEEQIFSIGDELKRTGKPPTRLLKHYGVKEPKYLTQAQAVDALAILKAAPNEAEVVAAKPAAAKVQQDDPEMTRAYTREELDLAAKGIDPLTKLRTGASA